MKNMTSYWNDRYKKNKIQWDIGYCSLPIKEYFEKISDKSLKILIPGCGNGYEAEYLFKLGFENVFLLDVAKIPLLNFAARNPLFPKIQLINKDFFNLNDTFDIIIEQTFFCSLPIEKRLDYVKKMYELLSSEGKLVGVLFDIPLNNDKPPYGGSRNEYFKLFNSYFKNVKIEKCFNSIPPRAGNEVFIIIKR